MLKYQIPALEMISVPFCSSTWYSEPVVIRLPSLYQWIGEWTEVHLMTASARGFTNTLPSACSSTSQLHTVVALTNLIYSQSWSWQASAHSSVLDRSYTQSIHVVKISIFCTGGPVLWQFDIHILCIAKLSMTSPVHSHTHSISGYLQYNKCISRQRLILCGTGIYTQLA